MLLMEATRTCVVLLEIQDIKMNEMAQVALSVYTNLGCAVAP